MTSWTSAKPATVVHEPETHKCGHMRELELKSFLSAVHASTEADTHWFLAVPPFVSASASERDHESLPSEQRCITSPGINESLSKVMFRAMRCLVSQFSHLALKII